MDRRQVLTAAVGGVLAGCTAPNSPRADRATPAASSTPGTPAAPSTPAVSVAPSPLDRAQVVARYAGVTPSSWGMDVPGALGQLQPGRGQIALTFDACGGPGGDGYDQALIDFLHDHAVPATLFLNSRWIDANPETFRRLAAQPLFEIGNHGTRHRPLSVTGRSAYGIQGTRDAGEVFDEVAGNHSRLTELLGTPPRFFRSGTAHYDDVAARIVAELGERVVGFTVNGDAGATYPTAQVESEVATAPPGAIVLAHMNQPAGHTAAGIAAAVPRLLAAGHTFTRLGDALR
ncbi:polysaccharide deacetylase family protein [Kitasatospora sp. NPDC008050]|uniref:polysaccharide deacetylase family protein n=1 Tax=Kitasatospora sp. NPDC008050 TaxID=3364021 RepID=UPI0036E68C00